MTSQLSILESATKHLTPLQREQFFNLKRDLEASGTSRKNIELRLRAFLWDVIESDDEDEEDE